MSFCWRTLTSVTVGLAFTAAATVAAAGTAAAAPRLAGIPVVGAPADIPPGTQENYLNGGFEICMAALKAGTVGAKTPGYAAGRYLCHGNGTDESYQWNVSDKGSAEGYPLRSLGSDAFPGHCLDDSNAGLRLFTCNSGIFQNWEVNHGKNVVFRNEATHRCVTAERAPGVGYWVVSSNCVGGFYGLYQQWS